MLIMAEYLANGVPFDCSPKKVSGFLYDIAALNNVLVKNLTEIHLCQDGLNCSWQKLANPTSFQHRYEITGLFQSAS